jgi:arylformamidase
MPAKKWIDISVTVRSGLVHWPGDPEVVVKRVVEMEKGAPCNVSHISMGAHAGTHMDGPVHFIRNGKGLETLPFEATIGPARVIEIKDKVAISPEELAPHKLKAGERVLFKTRNSRRSWKMDTFDEDFIYISKEGAQFLVDRGIQTVGVDYFSVGGFKKDGVETHQILLGAGIWIIESLNLAKIAPGKYDLICLPVKVLNSDGAPARAILRPR